MIEAPIKTRISELAKALAFGHSMPVDISKFGLAFYQSKTSKDLNDARIEAFKLPLKTDSHLTQLEVYLESIVKSKE